MIIHPLRIFRVRRRARNYWITLLYETKYNKKKASHEMEHGRERGDVGTGDDTTNNTIPFKRTCWVKFSNLVVLRKDAILFLMIHSF